MYLAGDSAAPSSEFVWVARSGEATPVSAEESFIPSSRDFRGWRLSPDGSRIAFGRVVDGNSDIWIKALPDGPMSRLTFSDTMDASPQWTPDGQSLTYRNGPLVDGSLWSIKVDGTSEPELLFDEFNVKLGFWSPDREWLVLRRSQVRTGDRSRDILAIRPGDEAVAIPLISGRDFWEQAPALSRDGRWLAYSSNETGRHEIFVRPFPEVDTGKWQVSDGGGIQPVWAHNGRELFFADPETRELKAAAFTTTSTTFQRARVTTLFVGPQDFRFDETTTGNSQFYDVAPDDERFLMARRSGANDATTSFVVVQNFFEELKRRVPK